MNDLEYEHLAETLFYYGWRLCVLHEDHIKSFIVWDPSSEYLVQVPEQVLRLLDRITIIPAATSLRELFGNNHIKIHEN